MGCCPGRHALSHSSTQSHSIVVDDQRDVLLLRMRAEIESTTGFLLTLSMTREKFIEATTNTYQSNHLLGLRAVRVAQIHFDGVAVERKGALWLDRSRERLIMCVEYRQNRHAVPQLEDDLLSRR